MRYLSMIGLCVVSCAAILSTSARASFIHASSASVSGGTSDSKNSDSPNSSFAQGILNSGAAFGNSDEYMVNGWVNDAVAVKSGTSSYEEVLTTSQFQDRYGVFPGGGPLEVTVAYKLTLVGNSVNGGGIGLRLEKIGGGIVDDGFSTISPVTQSGTLHAVQASCCTPNGVRIRLTGNVSTGGNSFGTYAASITEIKYNGQVIFTGLPPVPEPATAALLIAGVLTIPGLVRRRCVARA